jgi:four helix bundle protein
MHRRCGFQEAVVRYQVSGIRYQESGFRKKENKMNTKWKTVEDLHVFERAYKVSLEVHQLSLQFPKIEQYALGDQMRRASKSICANLAEGYGKRAGSNKEFRNYILISLGSSDEMQIWIRYCKDLGYVVETQATKFIQEYQEISKMLNSLYNYVSKQAT